jgi:fumarate reductase subunit D
MWLLFSVGGMAAALLIPIILLLFGVAFPLGWLESPDHAHLIKILHNLLIQVALLGLCGVSLFHWAHRFHYILRDGLRLKRPSEAITRVCYGSAVIGSAVAGFVLLHT